MHGARNGQWAIRLAEHLNHLDSRGNADEVEDLLWARRCRVYLARIKTGSHTVYRLTENYTYRWGSPSRRDSVQRPPLADVLCRPPHAIARSFIPYVMNRLDEQVQAGITGP